MKKLPKSLTKVTLFSKLLALLIIIAFIASAFFAGMVFDRDYMILLEKNTPVASPPVTLETMCTADTDCILSDVSEASLCCPNTACLDVSKASVHAVNVVWLDNQKKNLCSGVCPMIAVLCTKEISENNAHFSAKCISHVCQKVRS